MRCCYCIHGHWVICDDEYAYVTVSVRCGAARQGRRCIYRRCRGEVRNASTLIDRADEAPVWSVCLWGHKPRSAVFTYSIFSYTRHQAMNTSPQSAGTKCQAGSPPAESLSKRCRHPLTAAQCRRDTHRRRGDPPGTAPGRMRPRMVTHSLPSIPADRSRISRRRPVRSRRRQTVSTANRPAVERTARTSS